MWRVWGREEACLGFWWGNLKEGDHSGDARRNWEDNIKMDLQEVGSGDMDWIKLAQVRGSWWALVTAVMNLRVPQNAGNFLTSLKPVSCARTPFHGVRNGTDH
jgi:hypothetical protein